MIHRSIAVLIVSTLASVGCASSTPQLAPFPHGDAIQLLEGQAHLGDGRANGQDFIHGATAARMCSLVNMPRAADVYPHTPVRSGRDHFGGAWTVPSPRD